MGKQHKLTKVGLQKTCSILCPDYILHLNLLIFIYLKENRQKITRLQPPYHMIICGRELATL